MDADAHESPHVDDEQAGKLLGLICHATLGSLEPDAAFFNDLLRFQKTLERQKKPRVSRAAIRMWRRGGASPRRGPALNFLAHYLAWSKGLQQATEWNADRLHAFEAANRLVTSLNPYPGENASSRSAPIRLEGIDPTIALAMQTLLGLSARSLQQETEAFFRGAPPNAPDDASYFLCYRYSTNHGALVKSFIVIRKPVRETRTTFVFNEFVGGGAGDRFIDHLYRESEGAIFKLERGFYFLGSNYSVPVDKKLDPEFYMVQRRQARWHPNSLTMHVFEYDDVRLTPGLFGGVTLNVADLSQPILARVAMLHLGVRSMLGQKLTDDLLQPGEMPSDAIAEDLERVASVLQEAGCRRFGHQLEKVRASTQAGHHRFDRAAAEILRMIDNIPAWQTRLVAEAVPKQPLPTALGAIETYGIGRPRD